jgi:chromosome segregation ATPase
MIFSLLYLLSALSISSIAAYFSVLGLATIFPGAIVPIIIMGTVLELGKIITAIWLHRNWHTAPFLIKSYLAMAVVTLMGITSMGIFGFLSKAHIEHQVTTEKAFALASQVENKIQREQVYIDRQQSYIDKLEERTTQSVSGIRVDIDQENARIADITAQMNKEITFEQGRSLEASGKLEELNSALAELKAKKGGLFSSSKKKIEELEALQIEPRARLKEEIAKYNKNIDSFRMVASEAIKSIEDKKTSFRKKTETKDEDIAPQIEVHNKNISDAHDKMDGLEKEKYEYTDGAMDLEAEIGPVKYVAELIADITGSEFDVSKAVRVVIIILILVFDPLAILLVVAANISISKNFPSKKEPPRQVIAEAEKSKKEEALSRERVQAIEIEIEELRADRAKAKEKSSEQKEKEESAERELEAVNKSIGLAQQEFIENDGKLKSLDKDLLQKNSNIALAEESLKKIVKELESSSASLVGKEMEASSRRRDLEKADAENIQAQASIDAKAAEISEITRNNESLIKNSEDSLALLSDKKLQAKKELNELEGKSENLKASIETHRNLISSLRDTYAEAGKSSSLKDVFNNHGLSELVKTTPDGQKILSIKDDRDRVHQFIIPKEFNTLSHSYFHKTVEALNEVVDVEDLPHEYALEITKYIRGQRPQYNCLT